MHEYRIFETEQFRKDLQSIARAGHEEIAGKLRRSVYPRLKPIGHRFWPLEPQACLVR